MRSRRSVYVALIVGLLVSAMAAPSFAQDRQDIEEFGSGEVRDFDGDLELFCPDYPAGECLLILAEISGPVCTDDTPYVDYSVTLGPGVEADSVDLTFIDPDGDDVAFNDQPLTGSLLWPGATEVDGSVDWPGWTFTEEGWYLSDADALEFPVVGVDVAFEIEVANVVVAAPELQATACAPDTEVAGVVLTRDPPEEAATVLGVTLARTGLNTAMLIGLGLLLAAAGTLLVRSRRRTTNGA